MRRGVPRKTGMEGREGRGLRGRCAQPTDVQYSSTPLLLRCTTLSSTTKWREGEPSWCATNAALTCTFFNTAPEGGAAVLAASEHNDATLEGGGEVRWWQLRRCKVGAAPAQLARRRVIELCLGVVVYSDGEGEVLVGAGGGQRDAAELLQVQLQYNNKRMRVEQLSGSGSVAAAAAGEPARFRPCACPAAAPRRR
jgi:hypothetical protein